MFAEGRILILVQVLILINYSVSWPGTSRKRDCPNDAQEPWSYDGLNGPPYWGETYPDCYKDSQSPIAINPREVQQDPNLEQLSFTNYDKPITKAKVVNNGHTVQITPEDGVQRTIRANGDTFSLAQFHFHWGDIYYRGSEHTLNNMRYAMELHLVHANSRNELAVVGVFMQELQMDNRALKPIVDSLSNVKYKNDNTELPSGLVLNSLLPRNSGSFFRYNGSLTTPACSEGVTWSVLRSPISIGKNQITLFRKLNSADNSEENADCKLVNNFRPVQPLNGRKVLASTPSRRKTDV
ncbi:carbonic anhydrase 2-like [Uloborus diversus]|uniref:carbonic anhydrase 2-like n=1 Tax=Uloborus diversus TaxID=327109 RepID=UPI00240A6D7C|nr:carbonic anhydrase 2-like [Uloborus diversus]